MNYFKQAAGLIILIFVLAVLFMLFLSDQGDARRAEVQTESLQQDAITYSQADQCIEEAEQKKFNDKQAGVSQLVSASNSGYYDSLKAGCIAKMPGGISDPYFAETWEQKCSGEVEQFFLKEQVIEQEYAAAKEQCQKRYGY